jgi:predicted Zn-dependent protease
MAPLDMRALLERALGYVTADHAEARLDEETEASTRFANNAITQNIVKREATLSLRVAFDDRVGQASVNDFSDDSLRQLVARAEEIARLSSPDREYLPPPGPQRYAVVDAFDERVAAADPQARAAAVRAATGEAERRGLNSAGSFATGFRRRALANSAGLFASHEETLARFVDTVMTEDSSGWAQSSSHRWKDVNPQRTAAAAAQKAEAARAPRDLPPGEYTVVLEPEAVADYLGWLSFTMEAKAADEGRSAFSGKRGTRVGSALVTIRSQPDDPSCPACPIAEDGLPAPPTTWIEEGVVRSLETSRYWAQHTGQAFTGHPANFLMRGGGEGLEEIISSVDRGLLVTRFWYIRFVDPMKLLLTGMTRDGLYWIEDGEVRHPVKNMRFNDSPLRSMERLSRVGSPSQFRDSYLAGSVPCARVDGFRFTSGTAF